MNFGQVLTAMVTPFDQNGNVDFEAASQLVHYLMNNGTEGLVVAGTTGESPTLTKDEKIQLFRHVVEVVGGRIPVIAGTGSYNTAESVQLTREAEMCGVDGIMLVTPYYNKPSQEGLYQHFKAIAEATSLPVMLYNIPGRSVVNMEADTVVRLSQIPNIVAVKEASGNLDAMAEIIERTEDDFSLYSGDDSMTLPILSIGGRGVVSVASHVIGKEMKEMVSSFMKGEVQRAGQLHRQLLSMMNALFAAPSPAPVKAALEMSGISTGSVRLPLVPLNEEERQKLRQVFSHKLLTDAVS